MPKRNLGCIIITIIIFLLPLSSVAKKKVYENGDIYEGKMKKNLPNGEGTMRYADGKTYTGYWVNGVPQGQGSLIGKDFEYSGTFVNGQYYGQGELILKFNSDTITMSGFWENNYHVLKAVVNCSPMTKFNYNGSMTLIPNQYPVPETGEGFWLKILHNDAHCVAFYDGEWVDGNFSGSISFANRDGYGSMEMVNGKRRGSKIEYFNGNKYSGETDYDLLTGVGWLTTDKGKEIYGKWSNNKLIDARLPNYEIKGIDNPIKIAIEINPQSIVFKDQSGEIGQIKNTITPTNIDEILDSFIQTNSSKIKERWEYAQIQKKREEEERLRAEQERLRIEQEEQKKQAEFFQSFNNNYAGLIFKASGASFSDSSDDALGNALFGFNTDAIMILLPDGQVLLQTTRQTTRGAMHEELIAASLNIDRDQTYDLSSAGKPGVYFVDQLKSKIIVANDRNSAKYIFPSGKTLNLRGLLKVGPVTSNKTPSSLPLGTYSGALDLSVGVEASGKATLTLMQGNKYKEVITMKIENSLVQLFGGGDAKTQTSYGTYQIKDGKLILYNNEGKQSEKMTIILGGKALLISESRVRGILTR